MGPRRIVAAGRRGRHLLARYAASIFVCVILPVTAVAQSQLDPAALEAAAARNRVAVQMARSGDWTGATFAAEIALESNKAALGDTHPVVADSLFNLAMIVRQVGDLERARTLHGEALAARRIAADQDPAQRFALAESLAAVGAQDLADGRLETAKERLSEAVGLHREFGDDPLSAADAMLLLSRAHRAGAQLLESQALVEELLPLVERELGPSHPVVAEALSELATIQALNGAPDDAARLMLRVLYINQSAFGPDSVPVGHSYARLGVFHDQHGDYDRAAKFFSDGALALTKALGQNAPAAIELTAQRAASLAKAGDVDGALAAQRAVLEGAGEGPVTSATIHALINLATSLTEAGRREASAVKAAIARLSARNP